MTISSEVAAHPAADLFPMLGDDELQTLADDIAANGLSNPVVMLDGQILDGRNRFAACELVGVEPRMVEWVDPGCGPIAWVISQNLHRRHLTASQRAVAALDALPMLEAEAERRRVEKRSEPRVQKVAHEQKSRDVAAEQFQVNRQYISDAKKLAVEAPEKVERIRSGAISIQEAKRELKNEAKAEKRQAKDAERKASVPTADWNITVADIAEFTPDEPLDAIITDPPYPKEYLHTWTELGAFASRSLKPGGSLLAMSGQSYLPEIYAALSAFPELTYRWTIAYMTPGGQAVQLWDRKVNTFWKPILWFTKGDDHGEQWAGDVVKSEVNDNDKFFHHWGQSESGMADLIDRTTKPGQLVCDPFVGGGTTGHVAAGMGRRFVGIDIDADCVERSRKRLAA